MSDTISFYHFTIINKYLDLIAKCGLGPLVNSNSTYLKDVFFDLVKRIFILGNKIIKWLIIFGCVEKCINTQTIY